MDPRMSNSCASMSSSNALCLSGLSLVIVAIAPSMSSRTVPAMAAMLRTDNWQRRVRPRVGDREAGIPPTLLHPLAVMIGMEITGFADFKRLTNAERDEA